MISGAHFILYSTDADADRAFFRDVLKLDSVDAGHGWLIFKLPPSEVALHPAENAEKGAMLGAELYWMCDDLEATMRELAEKGVKCTELGTERWGRRTSIVLPGGGVVGLYQASHKTAIDL